MAALAEKVGIWKEKEFIPKKEKDIQKPEVQSAITSLSSGIVTVVDVVQQKNSGINFHGTTKTPKKWEIQKKYLWQLH